MRILFWTEYFYPYIGGAEILAAQLLPALRRRGHELVVITGKESPDLPDEDRYQGLKVYRYPFKAAISSGNVEQIGHIQNCVSKALDEFEPDLVHVFFFTASSFFLQRIFRRSTSPILVTLHGRYEDADENTLARATLEAANWVAACSGPVLAQTREQIPGIRARSSVVWNGLEMPDVEPEPLPYRPARLLCLGRLVPRKGFDLALTAFASLCDRYPGLRLVVAGGGPSLDELRRLASKLGVAARVDFLGWVAPEQVPAVINSSTMVLLPSLVEGMPLVAIQAAQLARPLVATRVDGLTEVVVDQETGLLIEENDEAGLAEAIELLLADPVRATRMGEAARRRAVERFSLESHVDSYDGLYRRLVSQAK